jgi:hypothetical protein
VAYKYINFESGVDSFQVRVAAGKKGGTIEVALDQPWHPAIGTIKVAANSGDKKWVTLTCKVKKTEGVHAVWLRFFGEDTGLFDVDWFKFMR